MRLGFDERLAVVGLLPAEDALEPWLEGFLVAPFLKKRQELPLPAQAVLMPEFGNGSIASVGGDKDLLLLRS